MEADDREIGFGPASVHLFPFPPPISPSPNRRLSGNFVPPNAPVKSAKKLAWVSLQGRLVGAEEATSSRAIGAGLGPQQALAWELFSPVQRVLVVAVIAVAVANSEKNKEILQLKKSVQLRDLVLSAMQEELDNLCEQVNYFKDQPNTISSSKNVELPFDETFSGNINYVGCGCQPCDYHQPPSNDLMLDNVFEEAFNGDEFKYQLSLMNKAEQEERRMSNLSDWAPSVSSSIDIQLQLDNERDIYNLRKECEEKDSTIKELAELLHSSEIITSKRIGELEDIIRRKKMIITKLKKDMAILEQKVSHLTRLRRPSFTISSLSESSKQFPVMADNLLYDMESTTSPSSSDSDLPVKNRPKAPAPENRKSPLQNGSCSSMGDQKLRHDCPPRNRPKIPVQNNIASSMGDQKFRHAKSPKMLVRSTDRHHRPRPVSPLKEKSLNQKPDSASFSRSKQSLSADGDIKTRSRPPTRCKDAVPQKR